MCNYVHRPSLRSNKNEPCFYTRPPLPSFVNCVRLLFPANDLSMGNSGPNMRHPSTQAPPTSKLLLIGRPAPPGNSNSGMFRLHLSFLTIMANFLPNSPDHGYLRRCRLRAVTSLPCQVTLDGQGGAYPPTSRFKTLFALRRGVWKTLGRSRTVLDILMRNSDSGQIYMDRDRRASFIRTGTEEPTSRRIN